MNDIKTILLIGRTGNGKSTLANVISGTSKFTEGEFAVSETKKVSDYVFKHEEVEYRIIDTVGIGDTKMILEKVLRKLALTGYSVKDGLSQILFVTDGRLAEESRSTYELLRKVIFDENIADYTTVVRTNFPGFRNKTRCEEEEKSMLEKSENFKELFEECKGIIYVDNPPIDGDEDLLNLNKKRRENSRKILLEHLKYVCQDDIYKPENLKVLVEAIDEHMKEKKKVKENMNELNKGKPKVKGWKDDLKEGMLSGQKWFKMLGLAKKNSFLNKKITRKMIEHIGKINPELQKEIEVELKLLENKKEKPAQWSQIQTKIEVPFKT